ncbi:MAG: Crp/Fnr family transcriptional regulator [Bacteroidetes bacterium]|nr:Crp/Fnr family transcriptional regulator [Bacteroidota bacterium]
MNQTQYHCSECKIKSDAVGTLKRKDLDFLSQNCMEITLRRGESIIRQGTVSTHIAYLKSGLAKTHMSGPAGRDQILKIVTPGYYIGIQAIMFDKVHRYSASALNESVYCLIDSKSFMHLVRRNQVFAYEIVKYLSMDELTYYDRFVNQLQKHLNGRLADALTYFSQMYGGKGVFHLPVSKTDLAGLIGSSRESVSRALKEMSETGVIRVDGRKISILNVQLLEKISRSG